MTAAAANFRRGRVVGVEIRGQHLARANRLRRQLVRVLIVTMFVGLALVGIAEITTLFAAAAPVVGVPTPGFAL